MFWVLVAFLGGILVGAFTQDARRRKQFFMEQRASWLRDCFSEVAVFANLMAEPDAVTTTEEEVLGALRRMAYQLGIAGLYGEQEILAFVDKMDSDPGPGRDDLVLLQQLAELLRRRYWEVSRGTL